MRVAEGHLITASGVSKGSLTPEHVILVDHQGRAAPSRIPASSEDLLHLEIYCRRPDVQAVVHAHPPAATAFAVAHLPLDPWILAEAVVVLHGALALRPRCTPGTAELANIVADGLGKNSAALLANHGAITVGQTLTQAHHRMETLEHVARVAVMARLLGSTRMLSSSDVDKLLGSTTGPYRWPRGRRLRSFARGRTPVSGGTGSASSPPPPRSRDAIAEALSEAGRAMVVRVDEAHQVRPAEDAECVRHGSPGRLARVPLPPGLLAGAMVHPSSRSGHPSGECRPTRPTNSEVARSTTAQVP